MRIYWTEISSLSGSDEASVLINSPHTMTDKVLTQSLDQSQASIEVT